MSATLAQILPTFLIALAVEGAVYRNKKPESRGLPLLSMIVTYLVMFTVGEVILLLAVIFGWTLPVVATGWIVLCVLSSVFTVSAVLIHPYIAGALEES